MLPFVQMGWLLLVHSCNNFYGYEKDSRYFINDYEDNAISFYCEIIEITNWTEILLNMRLLYQVLKWDVLPENPECESVQDFYFLPITSSLFTKLHSGFLREIIGKK